MRCSSLAVAVGLALTLAACTSVARPPRFVARVEAIEGARLMADVEALCALGPRPVEDEAATAATTAWLRARLEELGFTVLEEPVSVAVQRGELVARVRRHDAAPDSEPAEIALPAAFARYGQRPIESQTWRLRDEGWVVESYALRGAEVATVTVSNLFVEIAGVEQPERVIEVGAHWDTVAGSPGADDNSSGVAVLLELARVLADAAPRKTIRLCFFAAEEVHLDGSRVHVERITAAGQPVVEALLNLDSVGLASDEPDTQDAPVRIPLVAWMPTTGNFVAVLGTFGEGWLGNLFEACVEAYVPELPYYSANRIAGWFADARRSDHAWYWDADIPAVMLTDTAEFRLPNTYHRPSDTPDTLDPDFLLAVARATAATVLELTER